jgi:protein involved in polysaccharide export with SLBB domain
MGDTASQPLDPSMLRPGVVPYRLGPGDLLDIEVVGDITTRASTTVGPDGKVYYYLLPGTDVWGLTIPDACNRLSDGLSQYLRTKPVISITLKEVTSQKVWILGRVNNPGVYTLGGPATILDAVARAGGLASTTAGMPFVTERAAERAAATPEAADLTRSFLIRKGHVVPVDFQKLLHEGDLSQNVYLQPDDFLFLPAVQRSQVHVLGAVIQPQSERMIGSMTVVQAIALAGGSNKDANLSNVAILRGSLSNPEIAVVPVDAILHGKASDVRLQANDIVFVPTSALALPEHYANLILDTFARTLGVNEGAYAITGKSTLTGLGLNVAP